MTDNTFSRRGVLALAGAAAGVFTLSGTGATARSAAREPFTLGVASGDPRCDSVVLWTRLAPDPLVPGAGVPSSVPVEWELAADERMRTVVRQGVARATVDLGHSVHVEPAGLEPGREYWYRFRTGSHLSEIGRTKTLPHPAARVANVDLAVVSCQNYTTGYYTACQYLADDRPDLVLFLGDYIYEYSGRGTDVRTLRRPDEPTDLDAYRVRYAEYKADPDLRAAHAAAPYVCIWDDHEVKNDYAGLIPQPASVPDFATRRAMAYQAFYENLPMRRPPRPGFTNLRIHQRFQLGDLACVHMLDTRQYRDDQPCDDGRNNGNLKVDETCVQRHDPARTILGAAQRDWLLGGLGAARTRWNLIGQQVLFAPLDQDDDPGRGQWEVDSWDGYTADRQRLIDHFRRVRNPVILTGDVHSHLVNDIKTDFADPAAPAVATEFVTSAVSSPSFGDFVGNTPDNPHIKFASHNNGYLGIRLGRETMHVDVYTMRNPGGGRHVLPESTRQKEATFVVQTDRPGAVPG